MEKQAVNRAGSSAASVTSIEHQKNTSPEHPAEVRRGEIPVHPHFLAREVIKQTAAALGFPKDALSSALIAFTRFFSLSPKPELIASLRREILTSGRASSPQTPTEETALEAEALAFVSAADKGVVLSAETLERYAKFFTPPVFARSGEDDGGNGNGNGGGNSAGGNNGNDDDDKPRKKIPAPEELEAAAKTEAGKEDFLKYLNSIPGKNGQRWMVFPFNINIRGTELRVFLRILKRDFLSSGDDGELIADISGPARQWRCLVKKRGGKFQADIQVYPECDPRELNSLRKEAERFLGKGGGLPGDRGAGSRALFEEVAVRNGGETPSWVDDLSAMCLSFIDSNV